ncbi:MAG: hypothetical protein BRC50_03380 [Cyanobacteria bacterium SW_11_48_12]|nr:MAG: hypothetical protein BRC50_03380 [Cyanobacteria bacterium SW_11_48_12]
MVLVEERANEERGKPTRQYGKGNTKVRTSLTGMQKAAQERWRFFSKQALYSSSHLSGVHLKSTLTSDRILNLYLMSLRTAIFAVKNYTQAVQAYVEATNHKIQAMREYLAQTRNFSKNSRNFHKSY